MRQALLLLLASCSAELEHGLDEASANRMVLSLHRAGIRADKRPDAGGGSRFAVSVAGREVGRALDVLRAEGLPRAPQAGMDEVFGEASLIPTGTEERARYERAVAGELARTLERLQGVLDARVHLAVPMRDPWAPPDRDPPRPRASVMLRVDGQTPREGDVRALVAGAVDGLAPADVTVVAVKRSHARTAGPASPDRRVSAAWLAFASMLIAALAVALLLAIHQARALRRRLGVARGEGRIA